MAKNTRTSHLGNLTFAVTVIILTAIIIFLIWRVIPRETDASAKNAENNISTTGVTEKPSSEPQSKAESDKFPPEEHMSAERRELLQGHWNANQLGESTLPEIKLDIDGGKIVGSVYFITVSGEMIYAEDDRIYIYTPEYNLYVSCELTVNSDGTPIPIPQKLINKDGKEENLPIKIGALKLTRAG